MKISHSTLERNSFLFVCLLLLLSSLWIGRAVCRFSNLQMDMDEALHANRGLDFVSAIQRRDLPAVWQSFVKPEWYPPGHGLLLGGWFLFSGASVVTARLYSTFWYFLFGLLLWLTARELLPEAHPLIYLLPPFFLLADRLHGLHAALSMLELPATGLAFAALLCYQVAWRKNRLGLHFLALLLAFLCLLTRYNYGLVALAVLAIADGVRLWPQLRSRRVSVMGRKILVGCAVLAILLGLWFIGLGHWRWFFDYATLPIQNHSLWTLSNWLYYPRQMWRDGLGWLAVLLSAVAVWQAIRTHRPSGLWLYLVYFLVGLAMLTFRLYKTSHFVMLISPCLWIMAAVGAEYLARRLPVQRLRRIALVALLLGVLAAVAYNQYYLPSRLPQTYENLNQQADQAYRFIGDSLDITHQKTLSLIMLGRNDQVNGQALRFSLETRCMSNPGGCWVDVQDSRQVRLGWPEQKYTEEEQKERMRRALQQAAVLVQFSEVQEKPEGWQLIDARRFTIERQGRKPSRQWVAVYKR